jgi:hypothetical protein
MQDIYFDPTLQMACDQFKLIAVGNRRSQGCLTAAEKGACTSIRECFQETSRSDCPGGTCRK